MDAKKRLLPTRSELMAVNSAHFDESDLNYVDFFLHFMAAAEVMSTIIEESMQQETGLSEGRFVLMIALKVKGKPQPLTTLADFMGVTPATCSVMVRRMLSESPALIQKRPPEKGSKGVLISLTEEGQELLDKALHSRHEQILKFSSLIAKEDLEMALNGIKEMYAKLP